MTTIARKSFAGPYKELLAEMADLIDWLWAEHSKSFVKAGDDKVYAFGGDGYVIVFDESRWDGLIELMTPKGALTLKPGDDGNTSVVSTIQDEQAVKQLFRDAMDGLKSYYERRYWSTPAGT